MTIDSEKSIVLPFSHFKSMGKKIHTQGRITPKWIIRSGPNSNWFKLLCLSSLPASLTKIQSKVTEKSWRHHLFHRSRAHNSKITGQIRQKFILLRDFMPVLFSCKFEEDWIHSNWEKMETPFPPFKLNGNAQGLITPIRPKFKLIRHFMPVLVTYMFDKDLIKGNWENVGTPFCPFYMSIRSTPKPNVALPPPQRCNWQNLTKIGQLVLEIKLFESVDDNRRQSLAIL